jgi:hypothetical protein
MSKALHSENMKYKDKIKIDKVKGKVVPVLF